MLVAAQAGYAPSNYGSHKSAIGGYAAQIQPAATLTVLPSHGYGYGAAPSYGASAGYGAPYSHGSYHGYSAPTTIPYYSHDRISSYNAGVDANALNLAGLVWALPSAGLPNAANINIPHHPTTSYSAPAIAHNTRYGSQVDGASAAAAAANVADKALTKSNYY